MDTNKNIESQSVATAGPNRLLTPEEVSEWLGIPIKTLANWRSERKGPLPLRVGTHIRYRSGDVEAWIEERANEARHWMAS